MEREVERQAFARARGYLNYSVATKWGAHATSLGVALCNVALLFALWLFFDLLIQRGRIPHFHELSVTQQDRLQTGWQNAPLPASVDFLVLLHHEIRADTATAEELEFLWRLHLLFTLRDQVNGAAAGAIMPTYPELPDTIRTAFAKRWKEMPNRRELLVDEFGFEGEDASNLAKELEQHADEVQRNIAWLAFVQHSLKDRAGGNSKPGEFAFTKSLSDKLKKLASIEPDLRVLDRHPLADRGVLGLLVRAHVQRRFYSPVLNSLTGAWMWQGFRPYLTGLLIISYALVLIRGVLSLVGHELAARATIVASTRLRRHVYHHTFRLGNLVIRELGPNEAVTIFTRHVQAVHDGLYAWLTVYFREILNFTLVLGFALVIHFWLALAFLLFASVVWLLGGRFTQYVSSRTEQATNKAAESLTLIRETLMLMRLVKVYLMELFNQTRVERLLSRYSALQLQSYRGGAIHQPAMMFLGTFAGLIFLYATGLVVLHDRLGTAEAVILTTALVSLYWPLNIWLSQARFLRRGKESSAVLFQFLDRKPDVGQSLEAEFLKPLETRLEFDSVTLREPGSTSQLLLQDISFKIKAGQRVALVGSEEQEKHALVYLIPRFLDPSTGEIRIDDQNLRYVTLDSLRVQIGMVMQHNLVFHDSVANNISCGERSYTMPQIIEAAKLTHAHQFIQKLPQGYETPIGELGHALTTSEQFRLALARAIIRDPALLIVEEPSSILDENTKDLLDDTYAHILPGRTVIFLPHRLATIKRCDQVFLLHHGRLEAIGQHRELLASNPLYRHLHYLEFSELAEQV